MCRKILWCYVFILTLLDISLNTKLTAQGKSHGVTVQDSFIEGVTFQEWGKESTAEAGGSGAEAGEGGAAGAEGAGAGAAGGVRLRPAALSFGRAALAAAHARSVTLTNAANTTLHLASVAGTTPDFHASFFEAKTLPPQGNTTFNVVYLGRREGPVSAHLYIHTSLGVHKYPVSAVGVASEYDVWPLVGVRVPMNATVEPELTLYNPTDQVIQVSEVYSSGAWLGLRLAGGGERAPRDAWAVPPRAARPLVRLRLAPPSPSHQHPLTAYIRIKANIPGGGLVVAVEARGAAAGEHARPLHLRLRARGSLDPPHTMEVEVANSGEGPVRLEASVLGARCWPSPPAHPSPPSASAPAADAPLAPPEPCAALPPHDHLDRRANGNGGGPSGAHIKLLRSQLDPYQDFTKVAQLTLNYAELWTSAGVGGAGVGVGVGEAWCAGCAVVGRAALPYSVRLLPGTLALHPADLHFVCAERAAALRVRELRATNHFEQPLRVDTLVFPTDMLTYFHVEDFTPLFLKAGESGTLARIKLLESALLANYTLDSRITVRTNLSDYSIPLMVYSGRFILEWEWGAEGVQSGESVELGVVSAGGGVRVRVRLRNGGPAPLCVAALGARLSPAAAAAAAAAALHLDPDVVRAANGSDVCVEGGESVTAWLHAETGAGAGAGAGAWAGEAWVRSQHARSAAALSLRALPGRLVPRPLLLPPAAPYVWSSAELVVENSMAVRMGVVRVAVRAGEGGGAGEGGEGVVRWRGGAALVAAGSPAAPALAALGALTLAPDALCAPHNNCYTGLDINTPEGERWLRRGLEWEGGATGAEGTEGVTEDLALLAERLARYERLAAQPLNFTLMLYTTEVVQTEVAGVGRARWPRLAGAGAGRAGAAAAGGAAALRLLLRNPARAPLLLHVALPRAAHHPHRMPPLAGGDSTFCDRERCEWAPEAFSIGEWRVTRGRAALWAPPPSSPSPAAAAAAAPPAAGNGSSLPLLLLQPDAEIELKIIFAPPRAASLSAYLYLRNNLTILEGVQLWGQGAIASFEIGGRRPGSTSPIMLEVSECGAEGAAVVRRAVTVRNTGRVGVRLREWRVAGRPCAARAFRLAPCAPLHLAPNDSRTIHISYAADYTLARAHATLRLRSELGVAEFMLAAATPTKYLYECAAGARPPWEYSVRAGAWILSIAAFVIVLVAGMVDAERMMRHLHATRSLSPPTRPPLDLRGLAAEPPPPPAPEPRAAPPRRRRPARRVAPPLDPQAERRAFERWRAEVLRHVDDDDERSSEDAEVEARRHRRPSLENPKRSRLNEMPPADPRKDSPSPPLDEFEADAGAPRSSEEDSISSGSDASTPVDERDETEIEPYEAENEATTREPSPVRPDEGPLREPSGRRERFTTAADTHPRIVRPRRDRTESVRRSERTRVDSETSHSRSGPSAMKHHGRREKNCKRKIGATPATARSSGGGGAAEGSTEAAAAASAATGEAESAAGGARGSVRWGASWSSVVGGGGGGGGGAAPLPPIGSDVRRRDPERTAHDNSLFYFNGDTNHVSHAGPTLSAEPEFSWGTAADRSPFAPATHDSAFATGVHESAFSPGTHDSAFSNGAHDSTFATPKHDSIYTTGKHDSIFATGKLESAFAPVKHDSTFTPVKHESAFAPAKHDSAFGTGKLDSAFNTVKHDSPFGTGNHDSTFGNVAHETVFSTHDSTFTSNPRESAFTTATHDSAFNTGTHDYLGENNTLGGDAFGGVGVGVGVGGVWSGAGGAWPWSAFGASAPLRPPPGFGAPRSPLRPYDPFRSLASIWAPGAADWRPAPPDRSDRPDRQDLQ